MLAHRAAGVLVVRSPGSPDPVLDRADDHDLPRLARGGRWLATSGRFFPGYGRQVSVHCQTAEGCRNAVLAGADSLEHGLHLDHELLPRMATQGTAFVPTLTAFAKVVGSLEKSQDEWFKEWIRSGWEHAFPTVRAAYEAGVTVLAGTDNKPCGEVAGEISWLVKAGMPAEAAVGAGSWAARAWLGLPGLVDGGFADVVAYDADPCEDPSVLLRPQRIVLRGNVIV
jgi:imidazolonepropionase-like amidohydrolase